MPIHRVANLDFTSSKALRVSSFAALSAIIGGLALIARPDIGSATSTKTFEFDDVASFAQGELDHVAVRSDGTLVAGFSGERIALPEAVQGTWASLVLQNGDVLLATGNEGKVYRVHGSEVSVFAETGQLLVSSLAQGPNGTVYLGTLPEAKIFAADAQGRVQPFGDLTQASIPAATQALIDRQNEMVTARAALASRGTARASAPATAPTPGTEVEATPSVLHVWSLAYDAAHQTLFAATGPEGRVFAIDSRGRANLWWDSRASHAMSLVLGATGEVYVGTSDDALVVRLDGPGQVTTLGDFPGNEITSLLFDRASQSLVVAANEFTDTPGATPPPPIKATVSAPRATRTRAGKGRVYRLSLDGRMERILQQDDAHVTSLRLGSGGAVYAGLGQEGRIVRIDTDRSTSIAFDADERQVASFELEGDRRFVAVSDSPAFYRLDGSRAERGKWTSKVLDTEIGARFGRIAFQGTGEIRFSTRTGATEVPDETWTEWSEAITTAGPIRSPSARYLQIQASFARDAEVRSITAHYLPRNLRTIVLDVTPRNRPSRATEVTAPNATLGLGWRVENPDGDRMRYRLRFRSERDARDQPLSWRPMHRDSEVITALEYNWNTQAIPDGVYVVEVEASDELANATFAETHRFESEPIMVDNHAPEIRFPSSPATSPGHALRGTASDEWSVIVRLEYAIDGGEFQTLGSTDEILDSTSEDFVIPLRDVRGTPLSDGEHLVAVRAFDALGNNVTREARFQASGAASSPGPASPASASSIARPRRR